MFGDPSVYWIDCGHLCCLSGGGIEHATVFGNIGE